MRATSRYSDTSGHVAEAEGLAVGLEVIPAHGVLAALIPGLALRHADRGDLRTAIGAAGDRAVVDADRLVPRHPLHAGHGLTVRNLRPVARIPHLREVNIGHDIIARALFIGLENAVKEILDVLRECSTQTPDER